MIGPAGPKHRVSLPSTVLFVGQLPIEAHVAPAAIMAKALIGTARRSLPICRISSSVGSCGPMVSMASAARQGEVTNCSRGRRPGERAAAARSQAPIPPPFAEQTQQWPGLAGRMTSRPDHGEVSYGVLADSLDAGHPSLTAIPISAARRRSRSRAKIDVAIGYLPVEEPDAMEVARLIQ